jgi:ATP-binding cassette subfamily C protein
MFLKIFRHYAKKNNFVYKFAYLLDAEDRKNFTKFLIILFMGGLLSLLGIGAVIPFVNLLIAPQQLTQIPILGQLGYIQAVTICVVGLILAYWLKNLASFFILKKQAIFLNQLAAKVQSKLFQCYIYSPYNLHVNRNSSELVSNINVEITILSSRVIGQTGNLLNELVTSSIVFVFLLIINPIFSLLVVGSVLIAAYLFIMKIKQKNKYYSELRAKNYAKLTQGVLQGLGGIKETKIYQKETFFSKKVDQYAQGIASSQAFANVFQQSPRFLIEAVAITVVMLTILLFIFLGYSGQTMLILLTIFGVASVQLLPSMSRFMQALANIKYGYPALNKIYQEFQSYDQVVSKRLKYNRKAIQKIPFNHSLELKNISFSYQDKFVLKDINLSIPKGKRVAFVGPSGAGKTTLVDIILGVLRPNKGRIFVDGIEINDSNLAQWQKHFGYIPQMIYIYDCSLRENIAFGIESDQISDSQVWWALEQASLNDFVNSECEKGLDTLVGENGIRLSGGQRQRIGIARALYRNPDVLVMDEATAALDNQTEAEVTQALSNAERGRTIITIAHRLTTIQNYDIIYEIDKGYITESKTCV